MISLEHNFCTYYWFFLGFFFLRIFCVSTQNYDLNDPELSHVDCYCCCDDVYRSTKNFCFPFRSPFAVCGAGEKHVSRSIQSVTSSRMRQSVLCWSAFCCISNRVVCYVFAHWRSCFPLAVSWLNDQVVCIFGCRDSVRCALSHDELTRWMDGCVRACIVLVWTVLCVFETNAVRAIAAHIFIYIQHKHTSVTIEHQYGRIALNFIVCASATQRRADSFVENLPPLRMCGKVRENELYISDKNRSTRMWMRRRCV